MKQISISILILFILKSNINAQNSSPYWSLAGNSNASSSSKLGTTNNISLRFYTANTQRMIISSAAGLVGVGTSSPTERLHVNSASGTNAFRAQVNGGTKLLVHSNGGVAVGANVTPPSGGLYVSGNVTTGGSISLPGDINIAGSRFISYRSSDNNFFGTNAGNTAATGGGNTAVGSNALVSNTSGYWNLASGGYSSQYNTTGGGNTALGYSALRFNTTGEVNVAVGGLALYQVNGTNNTAVGYGAGLFPTSLSQCTIIGVDADVANGLVNATAIDYNAYATASNQVMLGSTSVTSVRAAGSFVIYSDGRFKNNIKNNVPGLEFINALKPVTYNYNIHGLNDHIKAEGAIKQKGNEISKTITGKIADEEAIKAKEMKLYTGFVAQEVEEAAKKLNYDFSGVYKPASEKDVYGLSYSDFVVPLVKAVQELDIKNKKLEEEVAELKELVMSIKNGSVSSNNNTSVNGSAYLETNRPNPFNNSSIIRYHLPPNVNA